MAALFLSLICMEELYWELNCDGGALKGLWGDWNETIRNKGLLLSCFSMIDLERLEYISVENSPAMQLYDFDLILHICTFILSRNIIILMKVITNLWVVNDSFISSSPPTLHRRHSRVIIHHVTPLSEERVKPSVVGQQFFLTITWAERHGALP